MKIKRRRPLLSKEVNSNDYIELMKMRLSAKVTLNIQIETPKRGSGYRSPCCYFHFENCFKHRISSVQDQESLLNWKSWVKHFLKLKNHIFPLHLDRTEFSGIGLTNTAEGWS
jgi:hypothetical protein